MKTITKEELIAENKDRYDKIVAILASGKAARFSFSDGKFKDVKSAELTDTLDMTAFRKSPELWTHAVCWDAKKYIISAVDI